MTCALWVVQGLLAALFLFAGVMKLILPLEQMAGPVALPGLFLRFIGVAETIGATVIGLVAGDAAMSLIPLVVALLAAFVAYGRWRLAPHRRSSDPSVLHPAR